MGFGGGEFCWYWQGFVCTCVGFLVGIIGYFFLTQGVFTLIFNFRTVFCCLVLAVIRMLVWGVWLLLSGVFVSFQSRSKLFSGDVLEVYQVLHCSPWAVMGISEHK